MQRINFLRNGLLAVLFATLLSISAYGQEPSKRDIRRSNQLVTDGNKAFNQKNYKNAIEKYAEAVVLVPRNAAAHFWKGYAHYYLKEYPAALTELRRQKLATARHQRKEANLRLRQRTLPLQA